MNFTHLIKTITDPNELYGISKTKIKHRVIEELAPVVQKMDNAIHGINHYPADSVVCFAKIYPLDSDLSSGQRYPPFEQLGLYLNSTKSGRNSNVDWLKKQGGSEFARKCIAFVQCQKQLNSNEKTLTRMNYYCTKKVFVFLSF